MNYENPEIPEGINYSRENPLKDFAMMLLTVGSITVTVVVLLFLAAGFLVRFIPFSIEVDLAGRMIPQSMLVADTPAHLRTEQYLQQLADQLAAAQQLPVDMQITVHYVDDDTVNAFATLGGHVFMHRGLISQLQSENALAMVLAHEIAHIAHRDPIIAAGRGLTVAVALGSLLGISDNAFAQQTLAQLTTVTALAFSRDQERLADNDALTTLQRHYGHVLGSNELFELLQHEHDMEPPALLSSHPLTEERLQQAEAVAAGQHGELTLLPKDLFESEAETPECQ